MCVCVCVSACLRVCVSVESEAAGLLSEAAESTRRRRARGSAHLSYFGMCDESSLLITSLSTGGSVSHLSVRPVGRLAVGRPLWLRLLPPSCSSPGLRAYVADGLSTHQAERDPAALLPLAIFRLSCRPSLQVRRSKRIRRRCRLRRPGRRSRPTEEVLFPPPPTSSLLLPPPPSSSLLLLPGHGHSPPGPRAAATKRRSSSSAGSPRRGRSQLAEPGRGTLSFHHAPVRIGSREGTLRFSFAPACL